jgi:hypothetical protein
MQRALPGLYNALGRAASLLLTFHGVAYAFAPSKRCVGPRAMRP